jgi:hypothetical protein
MFGLSDVKDKKVFLVCTLNLDTKLLPHEDRKNLEPKAFAYAPYLACMGQSFQ